MGCRDAARRGRRRGERGPVGWVPRGKPHILVAADT